MFPHRWWVGSVFRFIHHWLYDTRGTMTGELKPSFDRKLVVSLQFTRIKSSMLNTSVLFVFLSSLGGEQQPQMCFRAVIQKTAQLYDRLVHGRTKADQITETPGPMSSQRTETILSIINNPAPRLVNVRPHQLLKQQLIMSSGCQQEDLWHILHVKINHLHWISPIQLQLTSTRHCTVLSSITSVRMNIYIQLCGVSTFPRWVLEFNQQPCEEEVCLVSRAAAEVGMKSKIMRPDTEDEVRSKQAATEEKREVDQGSADWSKEGEKWRETQEQLMDVMKCEEWVWRDSCWGRTAGHSRSQRVCLCNLVSLFAHTDSDFQIKLLNNLWSHWMRTGSTCSVFSWIPPAPPVVTAARIGSMVVSYEARTSWNVTNHLWEKLILHKKLEFLVWPKCHRPSWRGWDLWPVLHPATRGQHNHLPSF